MDLRAELGITYQKQGYMSVAAGLPRVVTAIDELVPQRTGIRSRREVRYFKSGMICCKLNNRDQNKYHAEFCLQNREIIKSSGLQMEEVLVKT
jgi:hypothetical protein